MKKLIIASLILISANKFSFYVTYTAGEAPTSASPDDGLIIFEE